MEDKEPFIIHSENHGYWWPGDASNLVINSHGIDVVLPKYACLNTRMVNEFIMLPNVFQIKRWIPKPSWTEIIKRFHVVADIFHDFGNHGYLFYHIYMRKYKIYDNAILRLGQRMFAFLFLLLLQA